MSDQPETAQTEASEQGPVLTDEHHDWVAATFGIDPRASAAPAGADDTGGGSPLAAALPLPSPETIEVIEEGVKSGVRLIEPLIPEAAEGAASVGLLAGAVAAVGAAPVAAVIAGGVIAGAALAVGIPYLISHGEEEDQKPDPDERSLPGGAPPAASDDPDGGAPSAGPSASDDPDRHDEERYAEDVIKNYNPADDTLDWCDQIMAAIKGMIKALRDRYDAMAELGGGDAGHRQRYKLSQAALKKLIEMAKARQCPIDLAEAEDWSTYPLP